MTVVVRLGPLPLQRRSASRVAELERVLGTNVQLVEVSTVAELIIAVGAPGVVAVALESSVVWASQRPQTGSRRPR